MSKALVKRGGLGIWMLTALVAGNMIGSGIFMLPAALASFGSISLMSWIFTSVGALLLALVFAELSGLIPKAGGPYAYCREAFGDFIGFEVAYNYWIALWVGNAAIVVAFVGYLSHFFPILGQDMLISFMVKAGAVWFVTIINIIGVRSAGKLQVVTTVLKLLPLLLIIVFGFFYLKPENLQHFNLSGKSDFSALTGAATLTLWAFIGLESATVPAEDASSQRDIGRATIWGTLLAGFVYILSTLAIMGIIAPEQLAHSTAPFADAAGIIFPHWGSALVAIGAVISCFGALNGWTLLQGQVAMAAARDQLFPRVFVKTTASGTPINGLIISAVLITLLLLLTVKQGLVKQFTLIILLATLASLIPYFLTAMAQIIIYIKIHKQLSLELDVNNQTGSNDDVSFGVIFNPSQMTRKRFIKAVIIAVLAGIYSFWAIAGSGMEIVYYGCLLFFSGVPIYVWTIARAR